MAKELLWNDDATTVSGWSCDFESKKDFSDYAKSQYEGGECNVINVEKKLCVTTEKGLEPETMIPISNTDIELIWFYCGEIEVIESEDD